MRETFRRFAHFASDAVGSPASFVLCLMLILGWALSGPAFDYSNTWQLMINTGTTIVTFLMVFLIQNTQNRDSRAIHLKLDELIRSVQTARDEMVGLEDLTDEDLDRMQQEFARIRERAEQKVQKIQEHKKARASSATGKERKNRA